MRRYPAVGYNSDPGYHGSINDCLCLLVLPEGEICATYSHSRKKMKRTSLSALLYLMMVAFALSQWQTKEAKPERTEIQIEIDGRLDEITWKKALPLKDFIQFEPHRGEKASFETEVSILNDDDYIYFGIFCFDPEPEKIAASMSKRDDDLKSDDSVAVALDTFHDRRSCYFFMTNLLGTQQDGRFTDNGRTTDYTWDGVWKSAAAKTDFGWTVELAIPFSSLKYTTGEDMTWGMNVTRVVPRNLEVGLWTGPVESPYKVSQFGTLAGLNLKKSQKKSQIIPHVISKFEQGREGHVEAGLDARYALSQQVSGNLTVNPDFATVEADQEQINLTRFELDLPEKRNFFLEGSEIYEQRIRLFYSRRIGDIDGGVKVYGKSGGLEFSGLTAQARKDEVSGQDSANFSVFRLKKDVMKSSTLGFLTANKLVNGKNVGTAGIDTALHFTDTFNFTGQFAASYGEYKKGNIAFFLRPSYDSSTFHIHLRYTHLGEHFGDNANAVGFIRDDNRHELDSAVEKTIWLRKWGLDRISYESNYNIYWGVDKTLRSWKIDEEVSFDLQNKWSVAVEHHREYKLYEKDFYNHQTEFELGYNTREWQSASLSYSFGRNFDLDFSLIEASLNTRPTKDLTLSYDLERVVFDPDPEEESTWIHVIRATNYFTNDLFLKVFYQVNSVIDKKNIQVLFVYRFQPPFGSIQVAYQKGTARFGERGLQGHTLFIKLAYMF